ncbi:hypothetical protein ACFSE0_16860 [Ochrobactrum teleogrylli]|uniref:Uncharacterized protein n=1 Tax=Ochrobactrum teleogrylli TaxID=2479765 RepID=A0ABY2XYG8_9HYPH|nr:hypothetical protein [[Ochrobactrum] teleogrylli]TNV09777.1 hypothetical protein FIC94_21630 [[Ochrobactrum] teleogrylli]
MPTTITTLIAVGVISGAYLATKLARESNLLKSFVESIWPMLVGVFIAALIVSPIYIPLIENLEFSGTLDDYSKRVFFGIFFPQAITSFFSPSLFFESYNAMESKARLYYYGYRSFPWNTVYHLGLIGVLFAVTAIPKSGKISWISIACVSIVFGTLVRLFAPELIEYIFSKIPVIGNIGYQYWWPCIVIPMSFLIGYGIDNIKSDNARVLPVAVALGTFLAAVIYVWSI